MKIPPLFGSERLGNWLGRQAPRPAEPRPPEPAGQGQTITLDYPVRSVPRYGWGKPPHPQIYAILDQGRERYRALLNTLLTYRDDLQRISRDSPGDVLEPFWNNGSIPAMDCAALYGLLCEHRPRRYLEVGIGSSTRFARRAIADHGLPTRIIAVDPYAAPDFHALCDEIIPRPLEEVDLALFDQLEAGDVLFVDNSHRVFMNSDVTVVFMDILPRLKPGVLVQIHDIAWPADYPPHWVDKYYSEQYLLGAWLLAGGGRFEVVLPGAFVSLDEDLKTVLDPLWAHEAFRGVHTHGASFWLRTR